MSFTPDKYVDVIKNGERKQIKEIILVKNFISSAIWKGEYSVNINLGTNVLKALYSTDNSNWTETTSNVSVNVESGKTLYVKSADRTGYRNTSTSVTDETTVTLSVEPIEYTVNFIGNDANEEIPSPMIVKYDEVKNTPSYSSYTKNRSSDYAYDSGNYTVSFDANEGNSVDPINTSWTQTAYKTYSVSGWYINETKLENTFSNLSNIDGDTVYVNLKWATSTVLNPRNVSSITLPSTTRDSGYSSRNITVTFKNGSSDVSSETKSVTDTTSYSFYKWNNSYSAGASYTPSGNVTLKATWISSTSQGSATFTSPPALSSYDADTTLNNSGDYTITYSANGGTSTPSNQSATWRQYKYHTYSFSSWGGLSASTNYSFSDSASYSAIFNSSDWKYYTNYPTVTVAGAISKNRTSTNSSTSCSVKFMYLYSLYTTNYIERTGTKTTTYYTKYIFNNWSISSGGSVSASGSLQLTGNVTLTASWTSSSDGTSINYATVTVPSVTSHIIEYLQILWRAQKGDSYTVSSISDGWKLVGDYFYYAENASYGYKQSVEKWALSSSQGSGTAIPGNTITIYEDCILYPSSYGSRTFDNDYKDGYYTPKAPSLEYYRSRYVKNVTRWFNYKKGGSVYADPGQAGYFWGDCYDKAETYYVSGIPNFCFYRTILMEGSWSSWTRTY